MTDQRAAWSTSLPHTDLAPRPTALDDLVLGLLALGSGDSARFLARLAARLEQRHFLSAVVAAGKPDSRQQCPAEALRELTERCDVVIAGVCTDPTAAAYAALDAASLERRSIPCAVIAGPGVGTRVVEHLHRYGVAATSVVELRAELAVDGDDPASVVQSCCRDVETALILRPAGQKAAATGTDLAEQGGVSCEC